MSVHSNDEERRISLKAKEFKGSRFRCLMLTSVPKPQVARVLTEMINGFGVVDATKHKWMPAGFLKPNEARLEEWKGYEYLRGWWLKAPKKNAETPNWDIISTCKVGQSKKQGLLLVEAKAHEAELKPKDRCGSKNKENRASIREAIQDANNDLSTALQGRWKLSSEEHYQLCNRFAWAWKIADGGTPVILVYLGFLNAEEMSDGKTIIFRKPEDWHKCFGNYAHANVPDDAWKKPMTIGKKKTPLIPLIRTLDVNIAVQPTWVG